ncbi:hypothetical protein ACKENX_16385 [Acinetobacter baumannii]|uniref:hypothetical protein n=1 Tax=Acinetobacter baumannii TaxID=470 RepID=UPI0021CA02DB|nr:hypothetical protein [Acinetobacter baumannii]
MLVNNHSGNDKLKIILRNLGLIVADTITLGGASKLNETYIEIAEYTKQCNDTLYYLQVDKFLNSLEVDSDEFENFIKDNPDNLKLGLETIKLLEQTALEKQAGMLARALKIYIKNPTPDEKSKFHKNIHIITNLDHHLINEIEHLKDYPVEPPHSLYKIDGRINLSVFVVNPNKNLINFEFVKLPQTSFFIPGKELYVVSSYYMEFYKNIFID